ncbi:hypothetical protein [Paenibacillus pabuli]|uniref:hypothetical protein n=1 Tax=Paenibacillus pabuli TaxID=1472 RepID=UPI001FFF9F8C|nr:hypothetical protein [Paenibacillus pabuli]UPK43778.1 hypothetical protein KET34_32850 [Paenibacillus pabuli]
MADGKGDIIHGVIAYIERQSARYKAYVAYGILKERRVIRIVQDALNGRTSTAAGA